MTEHHHTSLHPTIPKESRQGHKKKMSDMFIPIQLECGHADSHLCSFTVYIHQSIIVLIYCNFFFESFYLGRRMNKGKKEILMTWR